jgi:hypothetical protein
MIGEQMTKITVWIALAGYAAALIIFLKSKSRPNWDAVARIFWTAGCIAMLAHIGCAFHFYHRWSHGAAYAETARQTAKIYGLNWGGGLFINYILMIGWIVDVMWWWRGLEIYRNRSRIFSIVWHVFLFFIFFNATVVFEGGFLRWFWLGFTLVLILILLQSRTGRAMRFNES